MTEEARGGEEPAKVRYVDLALGAWRPHEAAAQLAAALSVTLPEPAFPLSECDEIDSRAAGDALVLHAHDAATRIARALPQNGIVAVLAPRFGLALRQDNEWFFHFLKRRGIAIVVIGDGPSLTLIGQSVFERRGGITEPRRGEPPRSMSEDQRRLLRLFPGLLPRSLADSRNIAIGDGFLVPVGTGYFLIPPAWRDTAPADAARDLDAMAALEDDDDGMAALAERYCTAHFADSEKLCELSQRFERAGSIDIALEMAERARHVARQPEAMAMADIRGQALRRRLARFDEMLAVPPPSRRVSEAVRSGLDRLRVRAAAGVGGTAGIDGGFAPLVEKLRAGEDLAAEEIIMLDEYVAALASNEADRALEIAEAVREALDDRPDADRRLVYRNAMTLARLHRARGEADRRRAALERAFATSRGVRSLGEVVEMNILAALGEEEAAGPAARPAWLRAALAWLAFDPPEAAPAGVVRALFGERGDHGRSALDMDLCEEMADRMMAAWPELKAELGGEYPEIRAIDATIRPRRLIGGPGAVIGWVESSKVAPVYVRSRIRLLRLAAAALATLCPSFPGLAGGVYLVDSNLGLDIPATREAALSAALRARADELVFGEETIALDPGARARQAGRLVVSAAPAVTVIGPLDAGMVCRFARHRPEVALTPEQAETIAPLLDNPRMALGPLAVMLGKTVTETERLLRGLEALGVVRLDIDAPAGPPVAAEASPAAASGEDE
ncbi:MAG: hypothetical protein KDJ86_16630 [Bauldia sp.]|uniref:hypothetical protein n=1 Tax=Bauldia sp. TaxID=2575872 RepID=UPI001D948FFD|nr:hypothetical protein [Bauldia sp.]MCB1497407.1 hypothetical protein [Bauldia sp.]